MGKKIKIKNNGFTLLETIVSIAIFVLAIAGVYTLLLTGQSTFFNEDTNIDIQQSLRATLERITRELHQSGFDKNGVLQVSILDGAGEDGTDVIKFSMPIICHDGDCIIDANGDIAHWGAPLTWGCTSPACMDADNDCMTIDYKYVAYLKDAQNRLIRRVLDSGNGAVREDVVACNITDFQASLSPDQNLVTVQTSAQKKSVTHRVIKASTRMEVYLRNRG